MAVQPTIEQLEMQISDLQKKNANLEEQISTLIKKAQSAVPIRTDYKEGEIAFLQRVLETFPYPAYYRDTNGRFQAGNKAWIETVVGFQLDEIANKTMPQLPQKAQSSYLGKNYEQDLDLIQTGDTTTTCEKVTCADNIVREFFIQKSVVLGKNQKAQGIIGLMVDKSDLDLADILSQKDVTSLSNNRNVLQDILYSLPYGIMIVDAETHVIIDANPQTIVMVGNSLDQIVGQPCHTFICKEQEGNCPLTLREEILICDETSLHTSDNRYIPILRTVLKTTIGERICLVESFIDITETKKTEALRTEQEKMKSMFELAGAVCHELNQPLMIISGFAELIEDELDETDPTFANINKIKNQIQRMGDITKKLMSITKYETKKYLDGKIIDINSAA